MANFQPDMWHSISPTIKVTHKQKTRHKNMNGSKRDVIGVVLSTAKDIFDKKYNYSIALKNCESTDPRKIEKSAQFFQLKCSTHKLGIIFPAHFM